MRASGEESKNVVFRVYFKECIRMNSDEFEKIQTNLINSN